MIARGQDWDVSVIIDGEIVRSCAAPASVSIDFGLSSETVGHIGERVDRVYGLNGPATFTPELEPEDRAFVNMVFAQRRANDPNRTRVDVRINCSASIDFGDGGRSRVSFPNCVLTGATASVQGRTGRTTSSPAFMCPEPVLLG